MYLFSDVFSLFFFLSTNNRTVEEHKSLYHSHNTLLLAKYCFHGVNFQNNQ